MGTGDSMFISAEDRIEQLEAEVAMLYKRLEDCQRILITTRDKATVTDGYGGYMAVGMAKALRALSKEEGEDE